MAWAKGVGEALQGAPKRIGDVLQGTASSANTSSLAPGAGRRIQRKLHDIAGFKVSVMGDMDIPEADWAHLVTSLEAAQAASPQAAAAVKRVQVFNIPDYSLGKGSPFGYASRGGEIRKEGTKKTARTIRLNYGAMDEEGFSTTAGFGIGRGGVQMLGDVFTHEFGHAVDFASGMSKIGGGLPRSALKEHADNWVFSEKSKPLWKRAFGIPAETTTMRGALDHMGEVLKSRYSRTNASEMFAETYAAAAIRGQPQAKAMVESVLPLVQAPSIAPTHLEEIQAIVGGRRNMSSARAAHLRRMAQPGFIDDPNRLDPLNFPRG